jgi:predicted metalloprotease
LDETFFDEMISRFGAQGGDVAQAYVIAHEVGHHVQNLLGNLDQLASGDNQTSIRMELQADCYAGVWANSIKVQGVFEPGEIKEAMDAAAAVGDDRIQEKVQGYANPESFTHGTSDDRVKWFTIGYDQGNPAVCDTFAD